MEIIGHKTYLTYLLAYLFNLDVLLHYFEKHLVSFLSVANTPPLNFMSHHTLGEDRESSGRTLLSVIIIDICLLRQDKMQANKLKER